MQQHDSGITGRLAEITGHVLDPSGRRVCLAVLVAPDIALAPLEALESTKNAALATACLFVPVGAKDGVDATVTRLDDKVGVAELRLARPAIDPARLLPIDDRDERPVRGRDAASVLVSGVAGERAVARSHALVGRGESDLRGRAITLYSSGEDLKWDAGSAIGAPIAVDGQLVGLVRMYESKEGATIYAADLRAARRAGLGESVVEVAASDSAAGHDESLALREKAKEAGTASISTTLAGYISEQTARRDALDIKHEVNALCSVIAARNVKPPLAIGLFGDWGSGKSFFMDRMERRLKTVARAAQKEYDGGRDDVPFCRSIVQVRFNAWHYMDQNLWASMVQRVFERLAEAIGEDSEHPATAETLFARLDSTRKLLDEAERRLAGAQEAANETRQHAMEVDARRRNLGDALAESRGRIAFEAALDSETVRVRAEEALKDLGRPGASVALAGLVGQIREFRDLWPRVRRAAGWLLEPDADGRRSRLLVVLLWLLPLAGLSLVAFVASGATMQAVLATIPLVLAVTARARTALDVVNGAVTRLEEAQREVARIQADAEEKRLRELKAHEEAQARLAREEVDARIARDEAQRRLDEVQREIEEIRAGRRLYRYIQERARGEDYRKYQGVISLVRDDFQQLSALLRKAAESDDMGDVPPIERIVLYIDDLDRCPEERVVEVLQAVHLILAFDLFVVVVGVDSRWLLHALQSQYAAFLRPANEMGLTREEVAHWATSPQNYLEKIFQIPFTLRPMDRNGYQRLVSDLVTPLPQPAPVRRRAKVVPSSEGIPIENVEAAGDDIPPISSQEDTPTIENTVENGERRAAERRSDPALKQHYDRRADERRGAVAHDADDDDDALDGGGTRGLSLLAADLELGQPEVKFMLSLDRLIPSPRATKRFVNVYRLFRAAAADAGELDTLLGAATGAREPSYKAVLVLLATLTGYPAQAPDIFRALDAEKDATEWWAFARGVARTELEHYAAIAPAEQSTPLAVDNAMWRVLDARMQVLEAKLGYADCLTAFRVWSPRVARYSFHSGRVSAWTHGAGRMSLPMQAQADGAGTPPLVVRA